MVDYIEDLRIDALKLDEEVLGQSELYMKYSVLANESGKEYDDHKDFYKSEKARIEMEYRTGARPLPEGAKATEGTIKASVDSDVELIEIKKEENEKKRDRDDLFSLVSAMDQRKHSLSGAIKLWVAGYDSEPYQNTNENVNKRITRKTGEN